ncbi:hypothetical protein JL720_12771 [Aureococcus anophagefferens]|nr:hypothetical protein JL720_12771 [Aureococcus anophagefferens]
MIHCARIASRSKTAQHEAKIKAKMSEAARVAAPRIMSGAAPRADEDSDDGAEDEDEEIVTENPTYYKIPLGQRLWIDKVKKDVKGASSGPSSVSPSGAAPPPEEKKEDKEFMKVFMKGYRYKFESYSVESVRLCEEPGFMAKQDFVITTRRTAMTRTLADIVRPLVNSGMNPNNISNLRRGGEDLALTRSLLNATGAISDATAPGQHTLATALNRANLGNFVDEVMKFQACSPGHKLVRRFVVDAEAVCHSQFSFREKKVGGAIIAIDHTLKTLKGQKVAQEKVSKNRLTVWSKQAARR